MTLDIKIINKIKYAVSFLSDTLDEKKTNPGNNINDKGVDNIIFGNNNKSATKKTTYSDSSFE
jgi:hypothetical protein